MGSMPNCICYNDKRCTQIEPDYFVEKIEDDSYIFNKAMKRMDISNSREKIDSDIYKTLSPQYNFINPLPDIVVIKYKKNV